jgi:hypothetical protein
MSGTLRSVPAQRWPWQPGSAALRMRRLPAKSTVAVPQVKAHGDGVSNSNRIDMLIELQPKGAGFDFHAQRPNADRGARPGLDRSSTIRPARPEADGAQPDGAQRPNAANGPSGPTGANNAAGLFGSGATPTVANARTTASATVDPGAPAGTAAGATRSPQADSPGGLRSLLPLELVVYLREHRNAILVGLGGVCALLWVGSLALSRGRR